MAKYTIILLILTDFVPIIFIFNLFHKNEGGHSVSKKSQVDLWGGGPFPKFNRCLLWKASLSIPPLRQVYLDGTELAEPGTPC